MIIDEMFKSKYCIIVYFILLALFALYLKYGLKHPIEGFQFLV